LVSEDNGTGDIGKVKDLFPGDLGDVDNLPGRPKTVEKLKDIPYWPAPKFNMATTPCEETKTFPYTAIPPETDLPQRRSSSPRSPGNFLHLILNRHTSLNSKSLWTFPWV
jgi:hypothetical protein